MLPARVFHVPEESRYGVSLTFPVVFVVGVPVCRWVVLGYLGAFLRFDEDSLANRIVGFVDHRRHWALIALC